MKLIKKFLYSKFYNIAWLGSLFMVVPILLYFGEIGIATIFLIFGFLLFIIKGIYVSIIHGDEIHEKAKKTSFGLPKDNQIEFQPDIVTVEIEVDGDVYDYTFDAQKDFPYYAKLPDGSIWESNGGKMSYPPIPIAWKKIHTTPDNIEIYDAIYVSKENS